MTGANGGVRGSTRGGRSSWPNPTAVRYAPTVFRSTPSTCYAVTGRPRCASSRSDEPPGPIVKTMLWNDSDVFGACKMRHACHRKGGIVGSGQVTHLMCTGVLQSVPRRKRAESTAATAARGAATFSRDRLNSEVGAPIR